MATPHFTSTDNSSFDSPTEAPVVGWTNPSNPTAPVVAPELPALERADVWGMPFDCVTLEQAVDRIEMLILRRVPAYVITANLNYAMLNAQLDDMPTITKDADLILADGQPIVWRTKCSKTRLPERVAGSEMIYNLAERASQKGYRIYFLGGMPGVGQLCADRLVELYPGLQIAGVESPPFRELTPQEQLAQDQRIQAAGTDLLLVAFGQPKGERWIHEHYKRLGVPVSIQLGASFDFIAGTAKRAPVFFQKTGLEWAYRMMSDPKRLIPRYAKNAMFLCGALLQDWKRQVKSWGMDVN